jgi:uncharacterized protein (TIGR02588 family)
MAQRGNSSHVTSKWEWVAAAISAVIVIGVLAVLIRGAAAGETGPDIVLRVDSVVRGTSGYHVVFTAENRGTRTAAALNIGAELWAGDVMVESSTSTIDYLPGESQRGGGLFFEHDPQTLRLVLRPLGYEEP